MRKIAVVLALAGLGLCVERAHGQVQHFPYKAVVVKDDVLIRSGGNDDYYPTQRLKRDTVVTVHRQDPGGWLAIDPPEGSFSWIPARYVEQKSDNSGIVTEDDIIVSVGSEFGEESSVWQRKLAMGTKVRILGRQDLDTPSGSRSMYKIAPPQRERRWIAGDAVVPADEMTRKQHDDNPFELPSGIKQSPRETEVKSTAGRPAPSSRLQRLRQIRAEQRQLAKIDQKFRAMLSGNPTTWDLESIESEYNELRANATWRPVAGQIDLRFPAIDRYRRRQADYRDFQRLTTETERRDAELIASQFGSEGSSGEVAEQPSSIDVAAANPMGSVLDVPALPFGPQPGNPSPSGVLGAMIPAGGRYVGAGIVQRLPEGGYVLTSPTGRKLAQLKGSESVDLSEFVGKPVGLHGSRTYRDDIKSDFIEVSGLEPVRIRQ